MKSLAKAEAARVAVEISEAPKPSPRANFSATQVPGGDIIIFGGEFYDGSQTTVYNDLYRLTPSYPPANVAAALDSNGKPQVPNWKWKIIRSPNTPPHRCSHQAALVGNQIMMFGGEFATSSQFYHHSDTWLLNIQTHAWRRIDLKKGPSPRSGHRMVSWRNSHVILFGGFYQTLTHERWYNDVWMFDARAGKEEWIELQYPNSAQRPTPRSGTGFTIIPGKDLALLYGGFSEMKPTQDTQPSAKSRGGQGGISAFLAQKTKPVQHNDMWLLRLSPLVDSGGNIVTRGTTAYPQWERIRTLGIPPSPRVGFTMIPYKDRIIFFGGVYDKNAEDSKVKAGEEKLLSNFFNDLYSFDLGRKRWFQLDLKRQKTVAVKKRKDKGLVLDEDEIVEDDNDSEEEETMALNQKSSMKVVLKGSDKAEELDDNAFYYIENGKLVKVYIDSEGEEEWYDSDDENDMKKLEEMRQRREARSLEKEKETQRKKEEEEAEAARIKVELAKIQAEGPVIPDDVPLPTPSGRFRSAAWVDGHHLVIFGGLREDQLFKGSGDVEVTLDDAWRIDLRQRLGGWQQLQESSTLVWNGDEESEDDSDESDDSDDDSDYDSDGDEDEASEEEDDDVEIRGRKNKKKKKQQKAATVSNATARGQGRSQVFMTEAAVKIREIRAKLGLEEPHRTPMPGEELRDFFLRTTQTWVDQYLESRVLREGVRVSGKDVRGYAFRLCRIRYEEVWPLLAELYEAEAEQAEYEAEIARMAKIKDEKARKKLMNR